MRKNQKIRLKSNPMPCLFQAGDCLSRTDALTRIMHDMENTLHEATLSSDALRLIQLFNIDPEELTEAGVSYESLKALESVALFI
jgi:hypothetical protein